MAEISQEELDALRAAAAERDQMRAAAAPARPAVKAPPAPQFRALCADGSVYEYAGAHPTHVDHGAGPVAVVAVHPLPREEVQA